MIFDDRLESPITLCADDGNVVGIPIGYKIVTYNTGASSAKSVEAF